MHLFYHRLYDILPKLVAEHIPNKQERQQVLEIVSQRNNSDVYYVAWIRTGDINVLMRLRDWRPTGEVIAVSQLPSLI